MITQGLTPRGQLRLSDRPHACSNLLTATHVEVCVGDGGGVLSLSEEQGTATHVEVCVGEVGGVPSVLKEQGTATQVDVRVE